MQNTTFDFKYRYAVVRGIADSLKEEAIRDFSHDDSAVDLDRARAQWNHYRTTLESIKGLTIIEVPSDENLPDCVFTEDTLVAAPNSTGDGATILVTNPGAKSRRQETNAIYDAIKGLPNVKVVRMTDMDPEAHLEGGDVMFTGSEFFVGLTQRTNQKGIDVMRKVFGDRFKIHSVAISGQLHLKSSICMICPGVIACGVTDAAQEMLEQTQQKATKQYKYITVDNDHSANAVFLRDDAGSLVTLHAPETQYPNTYSYPVFKAVLDVLGHRRVEVDSTELGKVDGCLTCCSVLIP